MKSRGHASVVHRKLKVSTRSRSADFDRLRLRRPPTAYEAMSSTEHSRALRKAKRQQMAELLASEEGAAAKGTRGGPPAPTPSAPPRWCNRRNHRSGCQCHLPKARGEPLPPVDPPPPAVWPRVGEVVEVKPDGRGTRQQWLSATVSSLHSERGFAVRIAGEERRTEWLRPEAEGSHWRRPAPPRAYPRVKLKLDYSQAAAPAGTARAGEKRKASDGEGGGDDTSAFWSAAAARLPSSAKYISSKVPSSARDLRGSVLVRPRDRVEWFLCLGELMALTDEATRRHAAALRLTPPPTPMPVAYVAQRLDTDDPLWGWQVREATHGWLQGFLTMTTFTTWSADFAWDSAAAESGLPAARLANARLRRGEAYGHDAAVHVASAKETVAQVAAAHGMEVAALIALNAERYPGINARSKLLEGTELQLYPEDEKDLDHSPQPKDTPRAVGVRHGLPVDALLAINAHRFAGVRLRADTPLKGKPMLLRDREREAEVCEVEPSLRRGAWWGVAPPAAPTPPAPPPPPPSTRPPPRPSAKARRHGACCGAARALRSRRGGAAALAAEDAAEAEAEAEARAAAAEEEEVAALRGKGGVNSHKSKCEQAALAARRGERLHGAAAAAKAAAGRAEKAQQLVEKLSRGVAAVRASLGLGGAAPAAAPARGERRLDEDGELTRRLALQEHTGDPTTEGVVWPRIAEVGLLVTLGGGGALLCYALRQLKKEGWYHFVVCQATVAAVGFYERFGFCRVGAVARYAPPGLPAEELRQVPITGYRHWAEANELMAAEFGDISYLMALDLREWEPPPLPPPQTCAEYPPVTAMSKARDLRRMKRCTLEGGQLAYASGDGVVVSLFPEWTSGKLELRMEVQYEVETILRHRGTGESMEYEVRWAKWPEPSWEPASNLVGASKALAEYASRKKRKKSL